MGDFNSIPIEERLAVIREVSEPCALMYECAYLLGWSDLSYVAIHGHPNLFTIHGCAPERPDGPEYEITRYDHWLAVDAMAFQLAIQQEIPIHFWKSRAWCGNGDDVWFQCEDPVNHSDDACRAMRFAIVKAVIAKLKAEGKK